MLEKNNSSLQQYINNSYSLETYPKVYMELNGNEYGKPYFLGTSSKPAGNPSTIFNSIKLNLTARPGSLSPATTSENYATSINSSGQSTLLSIGPGDNSWFSLTPSNNKYVKFNMFLKSDPDLSSQIENLNSFNVVITATGMTSSGKIVRSEIVTENVSVDNVDWTPVTIAFANPDNFSAVDKVKLEISVSIESGKRARLIVSQLSYMPVSAYEVFVTNRLPLSKVFEGNRPGDFLMNISSASRPQETISGTTIYQQSTGVHMPMAYALGTKYEKFQRSVTPYKDNPFVYYVSGSDSASKSAWALYEKVVKTNKLVIKFNTMAFKPTSHIVSILTSAGWVDINSPTIDNNGLCVLYYRNGSWSTNPWTELEYPRISSSGSNVGKLVSNISGTERIGEIEIYGISLSVSSLTASNSDFSDLSTQYYTQRMELIELSPRLEVDLSDFITNLSIIKETDSDNRFLNIGGISSNSANVSLSNILLTKNSNDALNSQNDDIRPISNISSTSSFYGILYRGAKIRTGFIISSPTQTYVPSFYGEIDKWSESDTSITFNCFDIVKKLQTVRVAPLYLRGKNITEAIVSILDSAGFGDVYFKDLYELKTLSQRDASSIGISADERVPYFWTDKDKTVTETLSDIFKVYQIAMYADEYGGVKFDSLYKYNVYYSELTSPTPTKQPDLYIQDKDDSTKNIKSNLISSSVEENEIAKNIIVKYKVPKPSMSDPVAKKKKTKDEKKKETQKTKGSDEDGRYLIRESTNIVWNAQDANLQLPFIRIAREGLASISQNYIPYDTKQSESLLGSIPFSSELLIDDEIVSYEGIEFEFGYRTSVGGTIKKTKERIMNESEIITIQSELIKKGARILEIAQPTGKLLNVKRGLYGTTPAVHNKKTNSSEIKWSAKQFSKSNSSYQNMSSASSNMIAVEGGLAVNVNNADKLIYLSPRDTEDDSEILKNKTKLSFQFKLSDVKANKDGFFGAAVGTKISSGKLVNGLLVFVGIEENKKKTKPVIWVEQIVKNGEIKQLITKDQFSYADDMIEEDENIEVFISLNKKKDECTVLVGGSTIFEAVDKDEEGNKKKDKKKTSFKLSEPLPGSGTFGFIGKGSGATAVLGQFMCGNSASLEDLNDLDINSINDNYRNPSGSKADGIYFIGNSNLLDNIVSYQLISGTTESSKDNFAWFGTPVARGIKIFDVDYESFPVISTPEIVYTGYTYETEIFQSANIFSEYLLRVE